MKLKLLLVPCSFLACMGAAWGDGSVDPTAPVYSKNTHAIVKVVSPDTNTIISVPWTFYTPDGSSTTNLPVDRLVRPTNLSTNDYVLAHFPGGEGGTMRYAAWRLEMTDELIPDPSQTYPAAVTNEHDFCWAWKPVMTVNRLEHDGNGAARSDVWQPDGTNTAVRGFGVWLLRNNPLDENRNPRPFYLYGQWTTGPVDVPIPAGSPDAPSCTLLANPNCLEETDVNQLHWTGDCGVNDTLILTTRTKARLYCTYKNGKWGYSKQTIAFKGSVPVVKTARETNLKVPAGLGFWYIRREGSSESTLTLNWGVSSENTPPDNPPDPPSDT